MGRKPAVSVCCYWSHTHSDILAETFGDEPLFSQTAGQVLPVQRLVADSQQGIGACPVKDNYRC
jgi:hypothetical protein